MSERDQDSASQKPLTRLVRTGRDPLLTGPFVNPPVVHASTVIFEQAEAMKSGAQRYTYGRRGTPTIEALESAMTEIEGAAGTVLFPSGLSACSTALLAVLGAGDHLLVADNVYDPSRHFAATLLVRMGVEVTFFDPLVGAGIAALFTERTRAVYIESPGSLTFEMSDLRAIADVAHARGAVVLVDNTWATPLFFRPLEHGADLSIQAATKYVAGHSDVMIGTVAAAPSCWDRLKSTHGALGLCAGPDDIYLTLRGLRTMGVRLERQMRSAFAVASWLEARGEVARVLYPPLPSDPGHVLWKRDMTGASGLFGVVLAGWSEAKMHAFLNSLSLFGLGFSWGGFESLAVPGHPRRAVTPWRPGGALIRLHVGLEDPEDLIGDLARSFERVGNLA